MDEIEIAFYKGKTRESAKLRFWDMLVCFFDGSQYSHAEVILKYATSGAAVCASSSNRDGGVRIKHIHLKPHHWDIVKVKGDRRAVENWYLARLGHKYDWLGLVRTRIPWFFQIKKRYFCTESIAGAFKLQDPARYGPRRLYEWAKSFSNETKESE